MAASALERSVRLARRVAVVALVMGVLALHHLAAHHGAADGDHLAAHGASAEAGHDAEPAAGVDDLTLPAGLLSFGVTHLRSQGTQADVPASAGDLSRGEMFTAVAEPPTGGHPQSNQHLSAAVLTALALLAATATVCLARGSLRARAPRPARRWCAPRGRAPPHFETSILSRLTWLQVFVV